VTDLASWLLEQIAEDERVARSAVCWKGERWTVREHAGHAIVWAQGQEIARSSQSADRGVAELIAAHDPAHVLAECAAKRAIVEAHTAELIAVEEGVEHWTDCPDCRQTPPCHTLRLLAQVYKDRPGYREEWRP
jgi:hypothetical protein